jgi:2-polyprenyl-6-methoxyphenol hydroxylase-like FAD-dependent oxidoreductase
MGGDPRQGVPVDTANADADVIVVGAGPSGLVAALELVRQGVRVRVVDRKPAPVGQSRATIVHARTLEVFDRLGVAEEALGAGVPILKVELHERGRSVATLPLADPGLEGRTRFPCAVSLEQSATERILATALAGHGAQVEWNTALESLTDTPGGVEATVRHDDRTETIRARWLIGADGAASTVRRALGIPFEGTTYPQTGLLADVTLDVDLPADRLRLNMTRGGFVGILPLHGDRYRLFGAVPPGFAQPSGEVPVSHEAYAELATDRLHAWFRDYFSVAGSLREVVWASLFRCHSRIAERYGSGHVFLMGDAAHVHNPAGGQGMNLGIGDGANLGWKLAAVVRGEAGRSLLDTYEAERRPVTQKIMRATDRGFRAETTTNPVAMWTRMHVGIKLVGLTTRLPPVRRAIFRMLSQTWIGYRPSYPRDRAAADHRGGDLRPGDRAPHAPMANGGSVLDVLGTSGFHLLVFEGLESAGEPEIPRAGPGFAAPVHVHVVPRSEREAHLAYEARKPRVVLLRPDGHLANPENPFPLANLEKTQ